jgi:hypothetical protein
MAKRKEAKLTTGELAVLREAARRVPRSGNRPRVLSELIHEAIAKKEGRRAA